ncbi:MAG: hypothetical protein ACD_78C00377G0001, partial [uncultured bacterium (gcode 4)]
MSARTWIEGSDEDEFRRVGVTRIHSVNRNLAVFERLSEHFEEFGIK